MSGCLYIFILPRYQAKNQGLKFKLTIPSLLNKWLFHVAYNIKTNHQPSHATFI